MNVPIARLFIVSMILFAGLVGSTSWWTVVKADELADARPEQNRRELLRGLKVRRGVIRARDGQVIARSVRDDDGVFSRRYPLGGLFGHPIGYSRASIGQTGFESARNDRLSGREDELATFFDQLTGKRREGDDVVTTLDVAAQKLASERIAAAGKEGSVVALDPRDGAVRVMASVPGYDPNDVISAKALSALSTDETRKPLVNRAVQFGAAPGSVMKVVTAVAAIDSGKYEANSQVDGGDDRPISGVPLSNFGGESFGMIDLTTALARSVNTSWAAVAEDLGKPTMRKYLRRFGFEKKPELDYPRGTMSASGSYRDGELIPTTSQLVDVGRMGIGQDKLSVTSLQMAQVAAAVANDGKLMRPHIADRFVDRDGRTTEEVEPEVQSEVMSPDTAEQVTGMMEAVVERGSGTQAKIPQIAVAAKTGTAETEIGRTTNDVWFIAFAPSRNPRVAIGVNVQDVVGFGGDVAAPIARDVMKLLLENGK